MKTKKTILLFLLTILSSACVIQRDRRIYLGNWKEQKLEFSSSIHYFTQYDLFGTIVSNKWCCGTGLTSYGIKEYAWLRKKENLWTTFNTAKKIGLKRFLSDEQYNEKMFTNNDSSYSEWWGYSIRNIVDSLILTYDKNDSTTYFEKFWKRRRLEKNEQVVYKIILETKQIYTTSEPVNIDENAINKDMYQLISHTSEFKESDSTHRLENSLRYFNYLKSIGLEHSAYNFIFELEDIRELPLNRDSLLRTLSYDTLTSDQYWQTRNNAQWIRTYLDDGP